MPRPMETERRANGSALPLTRYQAQIPATKKAAEISTAPSMCHQRQMNDGLKITCSQSTGSNRPRRITNPEGVCIQELLAMIQVDDRIVPMATITVAANMWAAEPGRHRRAGCR